jgi:outer membrane protein TolC
MPPLLALLLLPLAVVTGPAGPGPVQEPQPAPQEPQPAPQEPPPATPDAQPGAQTTRPAGPDPQTTPPAPQPAAPDPQAAPAQVPAPDPLDGGEGLALTLEAAIDLALQNNLGLKIEELATEVTWYDRRGSWGAFDWVFSASGAYEDREFESTSVFGGSEENTISGALELVRPTEIGGTFIARFDHQNQETDSEFAAQATSTTDILGLTYRQPLLRGAWREYATAQQRQADLSWKRQSERERQIRHDLIRFVANAYLDLVLARAQLEVAQSSLDLARAQLEQDQRRLDAGIGIQLDVYSAETEVARNEELVLRADVEVRQSGDELKRLLFPRTEASAWDTVLVPGTQLPYEVGDEEVPDWVTALAVAIDRRAELRQQRFAIEQAKLNHEVRENERQGALDLELGATGSGFDGEASGAFESAVTYEFPTWRAALSYSIPIGNRTARDAAKAAWAAARSARLEYDQLEIQITAEIREAVRQVHYQKEAVRAARKSLELAERLVEAEQAKQREGTSTNFEVLRLQRDLTTAMSNERTARVNVARAKVALRAAQGLLAETPAP